MVSNTYYNGTVTVRPTKLSLREYFPNTMMLHSLSLRLRVTLFSHILHFSIIFPFLNLLFMLLGLWLTDFLWSMPHLQLTCDHFVGKVSAMGQPTRPTQPSIPSGSVNE